MYNFKESYLNLKKKYARPLWVLNILQWILVPLLIFMLVENQLQKVDEEKPQWYAAAEQIARHHRVDYVFIGSSRVAAAINARVFMDEMSAHLGRKVVAINLGLGYTTIQQHYMGMRNLLEKYPESFKNLTVFFEAPGGIVNYYYYSKWSYDWVNSGRTQLLIPVMRPADLFHFLLQSSENFDTKTYVLLKYYLNHFKIIRFRERVKERIDNGVMEWLEEELAKRIYLPPVAASIKLDLSDSGGVRSKVRSLVEYKAEALRMIGDELRRLRLRYRWDDTVFGLLVDLLQKNQSRILFFQMPVASLRNVVYTNKLHAGNLEIFKEWLKKWDSEMLRPDFKYNDDDFPDFSHLRLSRAVEYTKKVQQAYVRYLKKP